MSRPCLRCSQKIQLLHIKNQALVLNKTNLIKAGDDKDAVTTAEHSRVFRAVKAAGHDTRLPARSTSAHLNLSGP